LETIYSYYKTEKEFYDLDCKNQQEHMMYEDIFDNFVLEYIKPININYTINGNNGDINNILNFIF